MTHWPVGGPPHEVDRSVARALRATSESGDDASSAGSPSRTVPPGDRRAAISGHGCEVIHRSKTGADSAAKRSAVVPGASIVTAASSVLHTAANSVAQMTRTLVAGVSSLDEESSSWIT